MEKQSKQQSPTVEEQSEVVRPRQIGTLYGPTLTIEGGKFTFKDENLIAKEGQLTFNDGDQQSRLVPVDIPPEIRPGYMTLREAAKRYAAFADPANPTLQAMITHDMLCSLIDAVKSGVIKVKHRGRLLPVKEAQGAFVDDSYLADCRLSSKEAIAYFVEHEEASETMLEPFFSDAQQPAPETICLADERNSDRPLSRQEFQEDEILRVIGELEYDAKALPKDIPGKDGVKAEVRARLNFSDGVFKKAWERLSSRKEIIKLK